MYGLLFQSAIEIICAKYGQETWEQIKTMLDLERNSFSAFQQYGETLFVRIGKLLSDIQNEPIDDIMDLFGNEFVSYISNYGYDHVLRVLGHNMRDFLNGLDNLHEYMRYTYPRMRPPSFYVEKETAHGLILHYRSRRRGFVHYVIGQITEVGRRFYDTNVEIEIISEREEFDMIHVIFDLKFENKGYLEHTPIERISTELDLTIDSQIFFDLFPFHMVISESLEIISAGNSLTLLYPNIVGELIRDMFHLVRPMILLNWSQIILHSNNVFEFSSIEPLRKQINEDDLQINDAREQNDTEMFLTMTNEQDVHEEYLRLHGQMLYVHEWKAIIYLATPILENLDVMFNAGLFINDLSMHDSSRDLVLAGTQQGAELKLALDQEKQKTKALEESMKKLDVEMKKTDLLLYQMLPKKIADRLRNGEKAANLCETFESCTILFSDVVGFTTICSSLTPMEVVSILNEMYTKFDKCLETHNCYKIETIGDAYMIVSGLPERARNHAAEILDMAFDMLDSILTVTNPTNNEKLKIRIGCHSGPVVAGIAGIKMPRYCLFGDTVTIANKMEQTSIALHIHITDSTYKLLDQKSYEFQECPKSTTNGSLPMITYFVLNKKDRSGVIQIRPFHHVLEQMKQREIQATKRKYSINLNNINHQNSSILKEDHFIYSPTLNTSKSTEFTEIPLTPKINNALQFVRNSLSKSTKINSNQSSEIINNRRHLIKSLPVQSRSKTCELL